MRAELEERSRALGWRAECIRVAKHAHVYGTETAAVSASSRAANSNARHSRDIRIRMTFASVAPRPRQRPDLREPEPPHWAAENNGRLRRCEPHIAAVSGSTLRGPPAANSRNPRRSSRRASRRPLEAQSAWRWGRTGADESPRQQGTRDRFSVRLGSGRSAADWSLVGADWSELVSGPPIPNEQRKYRESPRTLLSLSATPSIRSAENAACGPISLRS